MNIFNRSILSFLQFKQTFHHVLNINILRYVFGIGVYLSISIAQASEVLVFPDRFSNYYLGAGFDPVTGTVTDVCIDSPDLNTTKPLQNTAMKGLQRSLVFSDLIETKVELMKRITGSTSLGFKAFTGSNSGISRLEISDYSVNILLRFEIEKGRDLISRNRLTTDAKKLLSDPKRFLHLCGSHYFYGEYGGGYLFALIQISTSSKNEQNNTSNVVSGMFQGVSFDSQKKGELSKILNKKNIKLWIIQAGGTNVPVSALSIEEFLGKIDTATQSIISSPAIGAYRARSYDTVSGFTSDPLPLLYENQYKNREQAITSYYSADRLNQNIRYVLQNPAQFQKFDAVQLEKSAAELGEQLYSLIQYLEKCSSEITECTVQPPIFANSIDLPDRINSIESTCYLKRSTACPVESHNSETSVSCGVKSYVTKRDRLCGVEMHNAKRTGVCGIERYVSGPCIIKKPSAVQKHFNPKVGNTNIPCPSGAIELKKEEGTNFLRDRQTAAYCDGIRKDSSSYGDGLISSGFCRNSVFGIELFRLCNDVSHGTIYRSCSKKEFGVESFKSCRHRDHGVERYSECLIDFVDGKEVMCATGA